MHGSLDESLSAFRSAAEIGERPPITLAHWAIAHRDKGNFAEARQLHEELKALSARRYVSNTSLMVSATAIGDLDAALEFALQACDEREPLLVLLARNFADLQRLREDPRYAEVLRRLAYGKAV